MDCLECGGTYTEKSGIYSLADPYVGQIVVQGVSYYQCDKCENILYSAEMAQAIESERNDCIHKILKRYPIGDFVGAAETSSMLGISRQALHKNRRIKHGFIYQTKCGPITLYLKQSVQQYKKTGDGRFPLRSHSYVSSTAYVRSAVPFGNLAVYGLHERPTESMSPFVRQKYLTRKEYSHAN